MVIIEAHIIIFLYFVKLNGRDPWMQDGSLPPFGDQPIGGGGENSRTIGGGPMWQGWNMRQTDSPGWV